MNKYEAVLLFSPELSTNSIKTEIEKFKELISNQNGKIINEESWGLRDLSYNINSFKKSFYNFFQIEINSIAIRELKKNLTQSENVIRHLFIKVAVHQALPTKIKDEKK
tara:strand:+ start:1032 stop:1358 length:327 start_codon:yes stop_codon:yes gene_type:complete